MNYNPDIHHRRSIRLQQYDYSEYGFYYVTLCVQNRECLFGKINNNEMFLNDIGKMIKDFWLELKKRFNMELDAFIIMPNHMHGIIVGAGLVPAQLHDREIHTVPTRATTRVAPTPTLGNIIGAFKSITTVEYIENVHKNKWPQFDKRLWQRNYYEHIIRNERSLEAIREYIVKNPYTWRDDELFISEHN